MGEKVLFLNLTGGKVSFVGTGVPQIPNIYRKKEKKKKTIFGK